MRFFIDVICKTFSAIGGNGGQGGKGGRGGNITGLDYSGVPNCGNGGNGGQAFSNAVSSRDYDYNTAVGTSGQVGLAGGVGGAGIGNGNDYSTAVNDRWGVNGASAGSNGNLIYQDCIE